MEGADQDSSEAPNGQSNEKIKLQKAVWKETKTLRVVFVMNFVKALVIAVLTLMNCEYLFPTHFKIKYILYQCF